MTEQKKITGRKRHIVVDINGWILACVIHAADSQDRAGAVEVLTLLSKEQASVKTVFADGGYSGTLVESMKKQLNIALEIVKKKDKGFHVLAKRWIVERTFAWLTKCRRLAKDFERNNDSVSSWIHLAMTRLMLAQLKSSPDF